LLQLVVPIDSGAHEPGTFVRRRADLSELTEEQRRAAEVLSDSHLLVLHGRGTTAAVELAHDAVIDHWPMLGEHLKAHYDFLTHRDMLRRRRSAWLHGGKDPAYLLSGAELETAHSRDADEALLSADEREFIAIADRHRHAQRRRWIIVATTVITLLVVLTAAAAFAWHESSDSEATSESVKLAVTAQQLMATRPDVAKQLAVLAYQRSPTPQAINAVLQGMAAPGVIEAPEDVSALAYSPDGTVLLVGTQSAVRLWNLRQRRFTASFQTGEAAVTSIAVRHDGQVAAIATEGGGIELWKLGRPGHPARIVFLPPSPATATRMLFSPEGSRLYTALDPNAEQADPGVSQVREWDVSRPQTPRLLVSMVHRAGGVPALSQDQAGRMLVVGGTHTLVLDVQEPGNPRPLSTIATRDGYLGARSTTIVGHDETWDIRDPRKPRRTGAAGVAPATVPASPSVTVVPATCPWDAPEAPAPTSSLPLPSVVSPDGRLVASAQESHIEIRAFTDVDCAGARWGRTGDGSEAGAVSV
jgi:hypothetical protein